MEKLVEGILYILEDAVTDEEIIAVFKQAEKEELADKRFEKFLLEYQTKKMPVNLPKKDELSNLLRMEWLKVIEDSGEK